MKYLLALSLFSTMAVSQNLFAHSGHESSEMGVVSKEYLNSNIAILRGVGTENIEVVSALPAGPDHDLAVQYTRQGIALHHAFQWEDSVRSFNEALHLDPNMARAYLGLITSNMNLANQSTSLSFIPEYLQKAAAAANQIQNNEVDRLWVDLMVLYIPARYNLPVSISPISSVGQAFPSTDLNQNLNLLLDALMNVHQDVEAFAFAGWDLQDTQSLEIGKKLFPTHSGIFHYLTHIYENSGRYQEAADAAQVVIKSAPDAPHLLHMYGHVLPMLGRWDEANVYFLKTHCIHKAILHQSEALCANLQFEAPVSTYIPKPEEFWHFSHNLELFGFSLMRTRDVVNAEKMFQERCDAGDCTSLVQFFLGEGLFDRAISTVDSMRMSAGGNNPFWQMKAQALIAKGDVKGAQLLIASTTPAGIEGLATLLTMGWAMGQVSPQLQNTLTSWIAQTVRNPNFDTWSHSLPILRKLYQAASRYNQPDATALFDAVQKIDKGHPL